MQKATLLISTALFFFTFYANAQLEKIIDERKMLEYLTQDKFCIDTMAKAIVLYEKGTITLVEKNKVFNSFDYKIERAIKLLSNDVLSEAEIHIPFGEDLAVKHISGTTYNLENGEIKKLEIRRSDMLKEKILGNVKQTKFILPSVQKGSIIYYTYTHRFNFKGRSPLSNFFNVKWSFQGAYPALHSEMEVIAAEQFGFKGIPVNTSFPEKGKFLNTDSTFFDKKYEAVHDGNYSYNINKQVWAQNLVPAIAYEPFSNTQDKIKSLNLMFLFPNLYNHTTALICPTWKEANEGYYINMGAFVYTDLGDSLNTIVPSLITTAKTNFEKAQSIYKYVRDSIICTGYSPISRTNVSQSLYKTFKKRKGTLADKNILLTAMLNHAGLKALPVLIATNEKISEQYYEPDKINYIVSLCLIDSQIYYLDASRELLKFGILLPKCYNGFAWGVAKEGLPLYLSPDLLMETDFFDISLIPEETNTGNFKGVLRETMGDINSYKFRSLYKSDSSKIKEAIVQTVKELQCNAKLSDYKIINLDNTDSNVSVIYHLTASLPFDEPLIYFDTHLKKFYKSNPFVAWERIYPIEMGAISETHYSFSITLPEGYRIEEVMKPVHFKFWDNSITYKSEISTENNKKGITLKNILSINKSTFDPDSYNDVRRIFADIIEDQSKKIIIKKDD